MKHEGIRRILRNKSEVKRSRKTTMAMRSVEAPVDKKSSKAKVEEQSGSEGGHLDDDES
jgi:hypothetical protein